jgi:hypothetical protein
MEHFLTSFAAIILWIVGILIVLMIADGMIWLASKLMRWVRKPKQLKVNRRL